MEAAHCHPGGQRHRSRSLWPAVVIVCLLMLVPIVGVCQSQSSETPMQTIAIDLQAPAHPFPHYWERIFGSGRAILSLRESYRRDLRQVKQATNFDYIRFHAIFHDEVGVYDEDAQGRPVYNFSYVDQIYDGLLANGVRPFVELSFMPQKLAVRPAPHPFWYHPNVAPPKDWNRWGDLVAAFVRHLVDRYGIDEVAQWYFEVWNEPNIDFWVGEPKESTYYQLYDASARAVKLVSPRLRVGGPATAQAAWVDRFIRHCADGNVPVDFVSTHVYANDSSENVFGTHAAIPRDQMIYRALKKVHDQVKASARSDLPIIFSEYNATYSTDPEITDSPFMGPWLAHTIAQCDGLVNILAYWAFSDVFEEQGVVKRPFYGGFGLIAAGNIPKAAFNAFKLLHQLGDERLRVDSDSVLATRRPDGSLAVAIWNYSPPGQTGEAKRVTLSIRGLQGQPQARVQMVDREHGSPLASWEAMGRPDFPSPEQQLRLQMAAALPSSQLLGLEGGDTKTLELSLPSQALALVEITK